MGRNLLTDTGLKGAIKRALASGKTQVKIFDGGGLYLLVRPPSSLGWRFKYRYQGREKLLSLGTYPDTSLGMAREKCDQQRRTLASEKDPSAVRRAEKLSHADTLGIIADKWFASRKAKGIAASTLFRDRSRFDTYIRPPLGSSPIRTITPADLLAPLRKMEAKGIHESATRTLALCGRIWRHAVSEGIADRDITHDLRGALHPVESESFAAIIEPKKVGELLRAIDGYQGQPATAFALRLLPLVFTRPGELRTAEWAEFDLDRAEWRIPGEKMKMREPHIVPLSKQVLSILKELQRHTGDGRLLFPSLRGAGRPISDNTLNAALRRLGYDGKTMVAHGFRSTASTLLNELGFPPDVIELQLAHKDKDAVRAVYNRAARLADRKVMMQKWADYLDGLKA